LRPFLLRLRPARCHNCWRWFCAMRSARLARTDRLQRSRGCIPGTHLYIKKNSITYKNRPLKLFYNNLKTHFSKKSNKVVSVTHNKTLNRHLC
jgi:hypothetical protein